MVRWWEVPGRTRRGVYRRLAAHDPYDSAGETVEKGGKQGIKEEGQEQVQRPQTVEKKIPASDSTQAAKPQGTQPPSVPSQPAPSQLRTLLPQAPAAGTFSRLRR